MLDHGLEIVAYALKLRQSHLLPAGTTPEDQAAQAEAWTAATAYAALLHNIGIGTDIHARLDAKLRSLVAAVAHTSEFLFRNWWP